MDIILHFQLGCCRKKGKKYHNHPPAKQQCSSSRERTAEARDGAAASAGSEETGSSPAAVNDFLRAVSSCTSSCFDKLITRSMAQHAPAQRAAAPSKLGTGCSSGVGVGHITSGPSARGRPEPRRIREGYACR